jgi:hypothetical protein
MCDKLCILQDIPFRMTAPDKIVNGIVICNTSGMTDNWWKKSFFSSSIRYMTSGFKVSIRIMFFCFWSEKG